MFREIFRNEFRWVFEGILRAKFRGWLRPVAGAKAEGDGVGDVSLLEF